MATSNVNQGRPTETVLSGARDWLGHAARVGCALIGIVAAVAIISVATVVYAWVTGGPIADRSPRHEVYEQHIIMPNCGQWGQRTYPIFDRDGYISGYECK